jgi:ribonuclease inhibitor
MQVTLNGRKIETESDVHDTLATALEFGPHYGNNLAALWDRLTTDVERPVKVVWLESTQSRKNLGGELFERIIRLMRDVEEQDKSFGWEERFSLELM